VSLGFAAFIMRLPNLCQIRRGILPETAGKGTGENWPPGLESRLQAASVNRRTLPRKRGTPNGRAADLKQCQERSGISFPERAALRIHRNHSSFTSV
jgi:hypothetical protein